jgi:hypothetical protein
MKNIFIISLILFLNGCIKERIGYTKSFIANATAHTIRLLPYYGATSDNSNIIIVNPNSTAEVYKRNISGKTIDPCFGTLLQQYDSVLITYDDVVKIPHIKFNLVYTGNHKILFSNSRSISNADHWAKLITNETKYSLEGNFTYTFVEQDYLDAK